MSATSSLSSPSPVTAHAALPATSSPLVSVIIPYRNQLRWLGACLRSCSGQTYRNLEWIIVDDASDEDPQPLLSRMGHPVKLVRLPQQKGPSAARNEGLRIAQGAFIQFLDADDFIHPRKIEVQVKALLAAPDSPLVLSRWRRVDCLFGMQFSHASAPLTPVGELLAETIADTPNCFPIMSGLYRKTFLETVGPWRTDLTWNEDREYRYRMLKLRPTIATTPDCFFYYRRVVLQPSRSTGLMHQAGGMVEAVRLDCAYVHALIADVQSGAIEKQQAKLGVSLRLLDLKQISARSHALDTPQIEALVAAVEKQAIEAGVLTQKECTDIGLRAVRAKASLRGLASRYVKPLINPRLWTTLNLIRNAASTWLTSWTHHLLARLRRR